MYSGKDKNLSSPRLAFALAAVLLAGSTLASAQKKASAPAPKVSAPAKPATHVASGGGGRAVQNRRSRDEPRTDDLGWAHNNVHSARDNGEPTHNDGRWRRPRSGSNESYGRTSRAGRTAGAARPGP